MKDVKQDLQRKIFSYQTILKKTYAASDRSETDKESFREQTSKQTIEKRND
jgi:hypothetical protein